MHTRPERKVTSEPVVVTDLLDGKTDLGHVIILDEVDDVINAIEGNPITVIVSNQPNQVEETIKGIATTLVKDGKKAFNYKSLVVLPELFLVDDVVSTVKAAIQKAQNGIIFIPNLQRWLFWLSRNNFIKDDLTELVRLAMKTGEIRLVTSASESDWSKTRGTYPFNTVKNPINLLPPSIEQTVKILTANRKQIEEGWGGEGFKFSLSDEAISEAARLGSHYLTDRPQPDAALDILRRCITDKKMGIILKPAVTADDVRVAMSEFGFDIKAENPQKWIQMGTYLKERIIGQDDAINRLTNAIKRAKTGLKDPKKPLSLIFYGPSGVGKTELVEQTSQYIFDSDDALIKIAMGEYTQEHEVARLKGAPPGYLGYDAGGQLTDAVRRRPYSVVLFDEIEKAHPKVFELFLEILDKGRLTDGQGKVLDFRNTIIAMTSNIRTQEEFERFFRLEFLGRFTDIVPLRNLSIEDLRKIIDLQVKSINKTFEQEKGLMLELTQEVKDYVITRGQSNQFGARNLRKVLDKMTGDGDLTDRILNGEFQPGQTILVSLDNEKIIFTAKS